MLARLVLLFVLVTGLAACQGLPDLSIPQAIFPTSPPGGGVPPPASSPGGPVAPVSTPLLGDTGTPLPIGLEVKVIDEASQSPDYSVKARYPYLVGSASPYLASFNQGVEDLVFAEIGQFAQVVGASGERTGLLQIDFLPTQLSPQFVSVQLKVTTYLQGAAHLNTTTRAINYDLQAGRPLALADLFQPGSSYLQALSDACLQELRTRQITLWEDGAAPREENFQVWNLTPEGLLVTFDEYRVADYNAGAQIVLIPYETLQPLANPGGPLAAQRQ